MPNIRNALYYAFPLISNYFKNQKGPLLCERQLKGIIKKKGTTIIDSK